eukprot:6211057-Lingulodinium_polyedra.AAC.1
MLAIPQGCPLSNMFLGLLTRPLLLKLRSVHVTPRLLADDLEVLAIGARHAQRRRRAQDLVDRHLLAMGSKVSKGAGKSLMYASSKAGRRQLRREARELGHEPREICPRWRGLGAHAT